MNRVLRTRDKDQLKMEILLQHISIKETYPWCSSGAEVNNTLRKRQEKKKVILNLGTGWSENLLGELIVMSQLYLWVTPRTLNQGLY